MSQVPAALLAALSGFRLPFEAARLLRAERRLWGPALVPLLLSLAAVGTALVLLVQHAGPLYALARDWMPTLEAAHWSAWLWVGPLRLLLSAVAALLFLLLAGASLVAASVLAGLLAAPFHDLLSARVERQLRGGVSEAGGAGPRAALSDALRSLGEELRRVAFFAAVALPLVAVGVAVPGAQLVCGPALLALSVFFLPLEYTSYSLDRRRLRFRDKRRWMLSQAPAMAGFGVAAFLACSVPLLNLLAMPLLVVAGTLLVLRLESTLPPRGPGAGAGTPTSP